MASHDDRRLVGYLQSKKLSKAVFGPWQTHFWIADHERRVIEFFKNDQALNSKGHIDARDIDSVQVSSDKSNKFFHLVITQRNGKGREFRMRSREQRDQWLAGVLDMMRSWQSDDRLQSIVSMVKHRTKAWSTELGLKIEANYEQLAELPANLCPVYVEGLETAVDVVRKLMPADGSARLFDAATLDVLRLEDVNDLRFQNPASGTSFDPVAKHLTVGVLFAGEPPNAQISAIDATSAMEMLSSALWRNPNYEGWATMDRAAKAELDRITQLLSMPFSISIQWGPGLDQASNAVQEYISEFVNAKLIAAVFDMFRDVLKSEDDPRFKPEPRECIQSFVTGVSIRIDSGSIRQRRAPLVSLKHTMWSDEDLAAAIAVTGPLRKQTALSFAESSLSLNVAGGGAGGLDPLAIQSGSPVVVPIATLRAQVSELILIVRLRNSCRDIEETVSAIVGTVQGFKVSWPTLAIALIKSNATIAHSLMAESRYLLLLKELKVVLVGRYSHLMRSLAFIGLTNTLHVCVRKFSMNFGPISSTTFAASANNSLTPASLAGLTPVLDRGVFSETMYLACNRDLPRSPMDAPDEDPVHPTLLGGLLALLLQGDVWTYAVGMGPLDVWFRGLFSVSSHIVPFPKDDDAAVADDEDAEGDGDADDFEDIGENVAAVRTGETRILTLTDVVNMVYANQGDDVELKVSAELITAGIKALIAAFPTFVISRHDMLRVLTVTLRKFQSMFVQAAGSSTDTLSEGAALQVLKDYCEYAESEVYIGAGLHRYALDSAGGNYSYRDLCAVVLSCLMPSEAVLAMRSRRDVLVIGLENVGKSLIIQSLRNVFAPTFPTMGASTQFAPFGRWVLAFHEIGGRHEQRINWAHFTELRDELHGIIVVLDCAKPEDFDVLEAYMRSVLSHGKLEDMPVLVWSNNTRTEASTPVDEVSSLLNLPKLCKGRSYHVEGCDVTLPQHRTAMDEGVRNGLTWMSQQMDVMMKVKPAKPKW